MDTNVFFNLICYLLGMIGRITAPEDVCDLIPESVILHGKRHFADVIKVTDFLERKIILDCLSGSHLVSRALQSRELSVLNAEERYSR